MHIPWRSSQFAEFAHNLDIATVERLRKQKGARYIKANKLLELRRKPALNTSLDPFVPGGLPRNCYDPTFLQSKSPVALELLNVQEELIEFPIV